MQITFKHKRHTLINTNRCVIPPTRGRRPIRRRLKSYGGTGEKAQSARVRWRMSVHFEEVCNAVIERLSAKDLWRIKCAFQIASNIFYVLSDILSFEKYPSTA
jgi:hypothetical protein